MTFVLPSWKIALEALAATAAVGLSAVTMFGADSAPKPRAVPVVQHAPRQKAAGTTTSTTAPPEIPAVDGGGSFSGGSDGGSASFGDQSAGASAAVTDPSTSPTTALNPGPPPVVSESEFPVALPISAVVIVGGGVGAVAWTRRRKAQPGSRR